MKCHSASEATLPNDIKVRVSRHNFENKCPLVTAKRLKGLITHIASDDSNSKMLPKMQDKAYRFWKEGKQWKKKTN